MTALLVAALLLMSGCMAPVHKAIFDGNQTQLETVLAAGASVEEPWIRATPLMSAASRCNGRAARLLIAKGAKIDAQELPMGSKNLGWTALHHAVNRNCEEVVDVLIAAGADPTIASTHGTLPAATPLFDLRIDAAMRARIQTKLASAIARRAGNLVAASPVTSPPAPASPRRSDADTPRRRAVFGADDFAFVVGIEEYQTLPRADFGARDAQTVRAHLEALGIPARNIVALTGAQATGNKLKSYLEEWLPLNVKPSSRLFVYYSGHGAPDPSTGEAYLVPWDGDPAFLKSTAYPLRKFYADLAKTKAKRVLVALDACFSGAGGRSVLAQGARPLVAKTASTSPAGAVTVLAAASGEEITGSLADEGHGMFTYFLLKGWQEGKTTPRELHDYILPKVQDEARRQNRQQTPVLLSGLEDAAQQW